MSTDVAVDGGQSGLRIALVRSGAAELHRRDGFRYAPAHDPAAADAGALVDVLRPLVAHARRVVLGLTNAPAHAAERTRLANTVRAGLAAEDVLVTSDMVTAHCGALAGADGVVVAAGTGAVSLARSASGHARSDGFGYLLGDEGSGFAVGRAGLRAALQAMEGRGPTTVLVTAARERYADVPDFPHGLYRRPGLVEDVAAFARDVAAAADAHDAVALAIWTRAAERLVESVRSVVARCPGLADAQPVPVSYSGGLFSVDQHLLRPFAERLPRVVPQADLRAPAGDALAGAVRLLAGDADGYRDLVTRVTAVPA